MSPHDIAFIGGGLSATALVSGLARRRLPLHLAVYDRGGHFGGGLTYSGPAAAGTLLLNPLELMPQNLSDWLGRRSEAWLTDWAAKTGRVAQAWLVRDSAALAKGQLGGLFIPRALYGAYLEARLEEAGRLLREAGGSLSLITQPVQSLASAQDHYDLGAQIRAQRVVLCTGVVPGTPLACATDYLTKTPETLVSTLATQAAAGGGHVVLAGANAAAMDVLYLLDLFPEHRQAITRITVVSPSGRLPEMAQDSPSELPALSLFTSAPQSADALLSCLKQDVEMLQARGLSPHLLSQSGASGAILKALRAMPAEQRKIALARDGAALSQISRRAIPAYGAAVENLKAQGLLHVLKGRIDEAAQQQGHITLTPGSDGQPIVADAVVDCRGTGDLRNSADPLLASLSQLAQPGLFGRGLVVSDDFEAAPNLFVLGDLLSGYEGRHGLIWHLQNAPRIEALAQVLAETLAQVRASSSS